MMLRNLFNSIKGVNVLVFVTTPSLIISSSIITYEKESNDTANKIASLSTCQFTG